MNEFDRNVKGLIEYLQCEMHGDEVALTQCSRLRTVKSESVVPARTSPDSFIVRTFAELRKISAYWRIPVQKRRVQVSLSQRDLMQRLHPLSRSRSLLNLRFAFLLRAALLISSAYQGPCRLFPSSAIRRLPCSCQTSPHLSQAGSPPSNLGVLWTPVQINQIITQQIICLSSVIKVNFIVKCEKSLTLHNFKIF